MGLGDVIKNYRRQRGLSQAALAKSVGCHPSFVSRLESGHYQLTSLDTIQKFAKALKIEPEELYKAAGSVKEEREAYEIPRKTPEELLAELETSMPIAIPIVADIHAGPADAVDYVYWARSVASKKCLKALMVRGFCMSPLIEEGDVIIIDPEGPLTEGKSIVVCHDNSQIWLKKYGQHGECQIYGVVIGINRRL